MQALGALDEAVQAACSVQAPEAEAEAPSPAEAEAERGVGEHGAGGSPCSTDDPLAAFDEGDCSHSADNPELSDVELAEIDWELSFDEWDDAGGSDSIDTSTE